MALALQQNAKITARACMIPQALCILNGADELIWRPLINPERLQFSVFLDKNPKGFGLLQRDRSFGDYQDAEQQFEKRPSLWIEPLGDWGEGSIDLIELPAPDEMNENIVCFWRPKDGLGPGIGHRYRYRMHWCWHPPIETKKATVAQTRIGESRSGETVFAVDFAGTEACEACNTAPITTNITASSGEIRNARLIPAPGAGVQRLRFEYAPAGSEPVDPQGTASGKRETHFGSLDFSLGALICRSSGKHRLQILSIYPS